MKVEEESKTNKGKQISVPFEFDDAMRRAMRVKQPESGTTNEDYIRANEERELQEAKP